MILMVILLIGILVYMTTRAPSELRLRAEAAAKAGHVGQYIPPVRWFLALYTLVVLVTAMLVGCIYLMLQ